MKNDTESQNDHKSKHELNQQGHIDWGFAGLHC